jgi:hypothetical protein
MFPGLSTFGKHILLISFYFHFSASKQKGRLSPLEKEASINATSS